MRTIASIIMLALSSPASAQDPSSEDVLEEIAHSIAWNILANSDTGQLVGTAQRTFISHITCHNGFPMFTAFNERAEKPFVSNDQDSSARLAAFATDIPELYYMNLNEHWALGRLVKQKIDALVRDILCQ